MKSPHSAVIAAVLSWLGAATCHAGCPNAYRTLDDLARQATDSFNQTGASSRCMKARELVSAEQKVSRFVEEYQVQCVLDQEIIDVQRSRLGKAKAARDDACGREQS